VCASLLLQLFVAAVAAVAGLAVFFGHAQARADLEKNCDLPFLCRNTHTRTHAHTHMQGYLEL
jgi:hypothetical protein